MMTRRLLALAALTTLAAPARGDDPKDVKTAYDLVYTRAGDAELKLDVAYPAEGDGPFPAVLVIHGGGWRGGSKENSRDAMNGFARHGYVAVSPQYRFAPRDTFPAQVHDVKAAVRWIRQHAKDYKVDTDHLGAVGFSAGGHLSLMLGVTGPDDGLEGDHPSDSPSTRIQAVVNYFGPTDFTAADMPAATQPIIKDFLGGTDEERPALALKASPVTYVSKDDAPILTFQGTKDPLVPHSQAVALTDRQTIAGVPGRVELLIGAGHGWRGDDLKHTMTETFLFFDHYLKPSHP